MKDDKKKQAFDKAVKQTVDYLYGVHSKRAVESDNPTDYLKNEIALLNEAMNSKKFFLSNAIAGRRDLSGFTDAMCELILSNDKATHWTIIATRENKNGKKESFPNVVYDFTVYHKLKEKYKRLINEIKGNEIQTGRPPDFEKADSIKWYNELKELPGYQHKNGKPHKTKIREEIIKRHTKIIDGQEIKPSMRTIKRHV